MTGSTRSAARMIYWSNTNSRHGSRRQDPSGLTDVCPASPFVHSCSTPILISFAILLPHSGRRADYNSGKIVVVPVPTTVPNVILCLRTCLEIHRYAEIHVYLVRLKLNINLCVGMTKNMCNSGRLSLSINTPTNRHSHHHVVVDLQHCSVVVFPAGHRLSRAPPDPPLPRHSNTPTRTQQQPSRSLAKAGGPRQTRYAPDG